MEACDVIGASLSLEPGEIIKGDFLPLSVVDQQMEGMAISMPIDLVQANISSWREVCKFGKEHEVSGLNSLDLVTKEISAVQEKIEGEGNLVLFDLCDSE